MSYEQALAFINQSINPQAVIIGLNEVCYVFGLVFLLLIGIIWLANPPFHH